MSETYFLILFRSEPGERLARIVIESLRAFGWLEFGAEIKSGLDLLPSEQFFVNVV
jgi:hypothetical protein